MNKANQQVNKKSRVLQLTGGEIPTVLPPSVGEPYLGDGECYFISSKTSSLHSLREHLRSKGVIAELNAAENYLACGPQKDIIIFKIA